LPSSVPSSFSRVSWRRYLHGVQAQRHQRAETQRRPGLEQQLQHRLAGGKGLQVHGGVVVHHGGFGRGQFQRQSAGVAGPAALQVERAQPALGPAGVGLQRRSQQVAFGLQGRHTRHEVQVHGDAACAFGQPQHRRRQGKTHRRGRSLQGREGRPAQWLTGLEIATQAVG